MQPALPALILAILSTFIPGTSSFFVQRPAFVFRAPARAGSTHAQLVVTQRANRSEAEEAEAEATMRRQWEASAQAVQDGQDGQVGLSGQSLAAMQIKSQVEAKLRELGYSDADIEKSVGALVSSYEDRVGGAQTEQAAESAVEGLPAASVQFMITNEMEAKLRLLGYMDEDIQTMTPARASAIIQQNTPSSRVPQTKPKEKRDRFELQFTCNVCEAPNAHSISRHAYTKGVVIVVCPGCQTSHLIADNLDWMELGYRNLEAEMAKRGTPVTRIVKDGSAAPAAAEAFTELLQEEGITAEEEIEASRTSSRPTSAGSGLDADQTRRIREAIREHKRRSKRQEES